ncbi:MAG: dTDP-4-dehydrorhamnose 3,5-epimerase [Longimicrobiales bacterium]
MSFQIERLEIPDVLLVRPKRHVDARGSFEETYRRSAFIAAGLPGDFVQDNLARSSRGVLRGLHYQLPPAAQGKLVGVVAGRIWDVAVDLRVGSATYARWVGRTLDADAGEWLWIPPGFAHGYVAMSDSADVSYKVTAEYDAKLDRGIRWNDPSIGIEWPVVAPILSAKDQSLPNLAVADLM